MIQEPQSYGRGRRYFACVIICIIVAAFVWLTSFGLLLFKPGLQYETMHYVLRGITFLSFCMALIFSLIISYGLMRSSTGPKRNMSFIWFVFSIVLFLIAAMWFFSFSLPLIYSPQALTSANLRIYNNCLAFFKQNSELKNLALMRWGWVSVDGRNFYLLDNDKELEKLPSHFSQQDIALIKNLAREIGSIKCHLASRQGEIILFYQTLTPIPTVSSDTAKNVLAYCISFARFELLPIDFLPRQGVIYSCAGQNPNEINSEVLNSLKPFRRITGDWYASNKLVLQGIRSNQQSGLPKSLLDYTCNTDGIDPNELHKFD